MTLAAGTQIGPYQIAELLGAGGMGEVYRAVDTRLGRPVAIKFLVTSGSDDGRLRRFDLEARAVSSLQHPNILALYDVGDFQERPFLVSELLEGETLRARLTRSALDANQAIDLSIQLCLGLSAAHDKGIVHRDIKPENLFITGDDILKILDFGIAKRTAGHHNDDAPLGTVTQQTETGVVLGTAGYMAPEQVRGLAVDARSDLFSAGVVLYEMFAGQRAFNRPSSLETAYAILKDEPPDLPANVPPAMVQIVRRCLQKVPDDRFQSARELAVALDPSRSPSRPSGVLATRASSNAPHGDLAVRAEIGTAPGHVLAPMAPLPAKKSRSAVVRRTMPMVLVTILIAISATGSWWGWHHYRQASPPARIVMAVLPFEDFTGDQQKEYFAEGLTEGMISQLGRLQPERLAVIARTSVNQYRHTKKSVKEIGHELGVQFILECSVTRAENRMRVDAQLIQASDQTQIWSESYEREIKDVLALQSDVARAIATEVRVKLSTEQNANLSRTRSLNPVAYDAYLRGEYFRAKTTEDGLPQAIKYFEQAIKEDPNYAAAYAGLAGAIQGQAVTGSASVAEVVPPAKAAALRAIALDEGLAAGHTTLATILLVDEWDWKGAEKHYRRALEIEPNNADTHRLYGIPYLASLGRYDESIRELERAVELSPLSIRNNTELATAFRAAKKYDRAEAQLRRTIELEPTNPGPHQALTMIHVLMGKYDDALLELEMQGATAAVDDPDLLAVLARIHFLAGRRSESQQLLARAEARPDEVDPRAFVTLYAAMGRRDDAFVWLEKAYQQHAFWLIGLRGNMRVEGLVDDPRYTDMIRRIGIPEPVPEKH